VCFAYVRHDSHSAVRASSKQRRLATPVSGAVKRKRLKLVTGFFERSFGAFKIELDDDSANQVESEPNRDYANP